MNVNTRSQVAATTRQHSAARPASRHVSFSCETVKTHLVRLVSIASLAITANAQPSVTWQTPVTISDTSDVNTSGIYFGSWAPQDGSANKDRKSTRLNSSHQIIS